MKYPNLLAAVAAALLFVSTTGLAFGQGTGVRPTAAGARPTTAAPGAAPAAAPGGAAPTASRGGTPSVVVIDIGEVFKQHAGFNQQLNTLKEEIKSLDAYYQGEQKKMAGQREKLGTYNPGSPEYKKLEEEVARMASDLQVEMALKQKNIAEQEAKVYFNTYKEIYKQVEVFADSYGITLVLRHNNVQMDPQKRDTVLQGVNRAIVFQRNLDITDEIVKRVNAGAATATRPAAPAAPGLPKR
ncbi:MAG: OmpH family outer membrane protein [Pirellulales bacterium]